MAGCAFSDARELPEGVMLVIHSPEDVEAGRAATVEVSLSLQTRAEALTALAWILIHVVPSMRDSNDGP